MLCMFFYNQFLVQSMYIGEAYNGQGNYQNNFPPTTCKLFYTFTGKIKRSQGIIKLQKMLILKDYVIMPGKVCILIPQYRRIAN